MARVRMIARQGDVEEVRYRKRDDGKFYKHTTEAPTDLYLVEVDGKRGSLILPRGNAAGWERDGATHWLTNKPNAPRRSRRSTPVAKAKRAKTARRPSTTRRKTKRHPPLGFKTWPAYMASIRPSTGGTVAKRKRRSGGRKTTARRHRKRAGRAVTLYSANRPRHARRHYRRNGSAFSMNGIVNQVKDGAIGAAAVVGGEVGTRLIRSRVLGMTAGTTLASAAEIGIATLLGVFGSKFLGRSISRDLLVGGYAGVFRSTAKQLGVPLVSEALSDDGPRFLRPGARRVLPRLNGYNQGLNGYDQAAAMGYPA